MPTTATKRPRLTFQREVISDTLSLLTVVSTEGRTTEVRYYVEMIESDFGGNAYRLVKHVEDRKEGEEHTYDVLLDAEGEGGEIHDTCDCWGYTRWQHCKHVDAVRHFLNEDAG